MSQSALPESTTPWLGPPAAQARLPVSGSPAIPRWPARRAVRRQARDLLVLAVSGVLVMVWLEGLAWITMGFARMFKEILGDEPLPAVTQLYIAWANHWVHSLRWVILLPLAVASGLALHHWRRRVRVAEAWRQLCGWLGQTPEAKPPAEQADWWRSLREPWVSTWARHYLGPPAPAFAGPPALPKWAAPPAPMILLLERQPAWPSASEWAATSRLLEEDEDANPANLPWLPLMQVFGMLSVLMISALALYSYTAPFLKLVDSTCGCG